MADEQGARRRFVAACPRCDNCMRVNGLLERSRRYGGQSDALIRPIS